MNAIKAQVDKIQAEYDAKVHEYWQSIRARKVLHDEPPAQEKCPTCGDFGFVTYDLPTDDPLFGKAQPCPNKDCRVSKENRRRAWEKRLIASGLPEMYQALTFTTWDALSDDEKYLKELAYLACRMFVERSDHTFSLNEAGEPLGAYSPEYNRQKNCLMLYGPVGTGKTGLAAAAVNALLERGKPALYTRAKDLIANVQSRYGKDEPPTSHEITQLYQTAPILVIDEFNLSTERKADRQEIVESVMRWRYGNRLPTIMTANVDQDQFEDMWGLRTSTVVVSMSHWIRVDGVVLRLHERQVEGI